MHDLSLTLLGRVQQVVKCKQQSTNTWQSIYSLFKFPAHQVKIFWQKCTAQKKGEKKKVIKKENPDKIHPPNWI